MLGDKSGLVLVYPGTKSRKVIDGFDHQFKVHTFQVSKSYMFIECLLLEDELRGSGLQVMT